MKNEDITKSSNIAARNSAFRIMRQSSHNPTISRKSYLGRRVEKTSPSVNQVQPEPESKKRDSTWSFYNLILPRRKNSKKEDSNDAMPPPPPPIKQPVLGRPQTVITEDGPSLRGPSGVTLPDSSPRSGNHQRLRSPTPQTPFFSHWESILTKPKSAHLVRAVSRVLDKVLHSGKRGLGFNYQAPEYDEPVDLMSHTEMMLLFKEVHYLMKEKTSTLVSVEAPIKVFGDIHGQFNDLLQFFEQYSAPSHRHGDINYCSYVFNGDFVDRGPNSLEVIILLFCLKVRYHERIILIRGNHEDPGVNEHYGFLTECEQRCPTGNPEDGETLWQAANHVFTYLPLAALVEGKILILHGGIGATVESLEDIASIQRPVKHTHSHKTKQSLKPPPKAYITAQDIISDVCWSDPSDYSSATGRPTGRGAGYTFGPNRVNTFCKNTGVELIIRSHEVKNEGWEVQAYDRTLTVFSAPCYGGKHRNAGAMIEISRELHVIAKILAPDNAHKTWTVVKNLDGIDFKRNLLRSDSRTLSREDVLNSRKDSLIKEFNINDL
eukprot:g4955.t1